MAFEPNRFQRNSDESTHRFRRERAQVYAEGVNYASEGLAFEPVRARMPTLDQRRPTFLP